VNDHELEQLLNRYRPVGPPDDLFSSITGLVRSRTAGVRRAWPWAVAAAALLALTIGLHMSAFVPGPELTSTEQTALARQLGGDALAERAAQFILAPQTPRDTNEGQTPWQTR
jgi:hypothetical protein